MKFKKGHRRYVILLGPFALKIPRVKLWGHSVKDFLWPRLWLKGLTLMVWWSFKEGILHNVMEIGTFFSSARRFVAPILLPFIIFNVMRRERGVGVLPLDLHSLMVEKIRELPESYRHDLFFLYDHCGHTFIRENIAVHGGRAKFIDYGHRGVKPLLLKYGDVIEVLLLSIAEEHREPNL